MRHALLKAPGADAPLYRPGRNRACCVVQEKASTEKCKKEFYDSDMGRLVKRHTDSHPAMAEVVNWALEEATDPQATVGWTPSDSALEVVGEADGRQTVRAVVPVVGQRKFVRLRVRMR